MPRVTFNPSGRNVDAPAGEGLLTVAARAGIALRAPCGGRGRCGKCHIVVENAPEADAVEIEAIAPDEIARGVRLACRLTVKGDMVVTVGSESLLYDERILVDGSVGGRPAAPAIVATEFELVEPSLEDNRDDLARLAAAVGRETEHLRGRLHSLRALPGVLRDGGFRGVAVMDSRRLLDVVPPDSAPSVLGAAFDLGTTTLAGALVSLPTGEILATSSRANPQAVHGDDVVSRMDHARGGAEELDGLRRLVAGCFDEMLGEMLDVAGASRDRVYRATVAGNTVMTHLFLGIPPDNIAVAPFAPAVTSAVKAPAAELGLEVSESAVVETLPCVAGYVGGDIVGGMLASNVDLQTGVTLYVDIGTNGEVVMARDGEMWACSVAAGAAFEGARIAQGMRAAAGAIDKVSIDGDDISCTTVSAGSPRGICGTGLIDAAAVMLDSGVLESTGYLADPGSGEGAIAKRLVEHQGQTAFELAEGDAGKVYLTQRDLRELQLAKGAICAGVTILMSEMNVTGSDIDRVLLAGGFGTFVDGLNVLKVGLLPGGIDVSRIEFVGNAAAAGAREVLVSDSHSRRAAEIARAVQYVELSGRADFQMAFAEAMMFPGAGGD